jgi:hypothetical protein
VVRAEDSRPRGRGFKSRRYWMDVSDNASYYIEEKLKIKRERDLNNNVN